MKWSDEKDRFQNQPWYIRLWRRRYYFNVPFDAISNWWRTRKVPALNFGFGNCWSIAVGTSHFKMKWYYTSDELKEKMKDWN